MPNIKSAIKRVEIAERNRLRNKSWRTSVRTVRNEVTASLKEGNLTASQETLKHAYCIIDMAVSKGVLHRNAAARRKSKLALKVFQQVSQQVPQKAAKIKTVRK